MLEMIGPFVPWIIGWIICIPIFFGGWMYSTDPKYNSEIFKIGVFAVFWPVTILMIIGAVISSLLYDK